MEIEAVAQFVSAIENPSRPDGPADISVDEDRNRLLVPLFNAGQPHSRYWTPKKKLRIESGVGRFRPATSDLARSTHVLFIIAGDAGGINLSSHGRVVAYAETGQTGVCRDCSLLVVKNRPIFH